MALMQTLKPRRSARGILFVTRFKSGPGLIWGAASLVVFFAIWQLSGNFVKPIYFSTPSRVVSALGTMLSKGELLPAMWQTAVIVVLGFGSSALVGIAAGLALGRSIKLRTAISPLISMAIAAPFVALLPLMEIWFGLGLLARVAFTFILCIWLVVINTYIGVASLSATYKELSESMSLSKFEAIRYIILPGASPYIYAGLRISAAQAIVGAVLAGQEVGASGLGGLAGSYGSFFQTSHLIVTIVASTILAFMLFGLLRLFQSVRSPWIHATGQG